MTGIKTIAATAALVFAGTAVAFGGVHLGQPNAGASPTPAPTTDAVKATSTVTLTEGQLEHLATLLANAQSRTRAGRHAAHEAVRHSRVRTVARQVTPVRTRSTRTAGSTTRAATHAVCPTTHVSHDDFHDGDHSGSHGGCGDGGCD
jgi:hypothetical protein